MNTARGECSELVEGEMRVPLRFLSTESTWRL